MSLLKDYQQQSQCSCPHWTREISVLTLNYSVHRYGLFVTFPTCNNSVQSFKANLDHDFPDYIALTGSGPDHHITSHHITSHHITSHHPWLECTLQCKQLWYVSTKVGPLEDNSNLIQDGKELARDIRHWIEINQVCISKITERWWNLL